VDVYASALALPFRDGVFDTVLGVGVLALVPEPGHLLAEAARVLRPGGGLFLTAPWLDAPSTGQRDFYRYTERGLRHLLTASGFRVLTIEQTTGLVAGATQRLVAAAFAGLHLDRSLPRALAGGLAAAAAQIPAAAADAALGHRGEPLDILAIAERVLSDERWAMSGE
jgi:SAM-dependent methyltransferase